MLAVTLALLLALGACGAPEKSSGLLTDEEIGKLESLYFTDSGAALEGLGLSENDLDRDSEDYESLSSAGAYPLKESRSIAGVDFRQIFLTSVTQPEGLYGVRFLALFTDEQEAQDAMQAIRDKAAELYGEPSEVGVESWKAGELTELELRFCDASTAANYSPDWDYRYSLTLDFRVPSVVDGRLLTGDEILEMVRNAQQKQ